MKRVYLPLVVATLVVAGCDSFRDFVGATVVVPNEFNVMTHAPLQIPKNLETLPEPQVGLDRPQESDPSDSAYAVLVGRGSDEEPQTTEVALMTNAGAMEIDSSVRMLLEQERQQFIEEIPWIEEINPFRDITDPSSVRLDPVAERARLERNAQQGLPPNEGDFGETILDEGQGAIFEGLF